MARLKAYTVTSGITPEEIKEEVLKRLKVTEEESKEDTFALTFDYFTKKLYVILSERMVEKDKKINAHMLEIKADTRIQDEQIAKINSILSMIIKSDGGIISDKITLSYSELLELLDQKDKKIAELEREIERLKKELGEATGDPYNVYYGYIDEDREPYIDMDIKVLQNSKIQRNRHLIWRDIDLSYAKIVYAYPKAFGALERILDRNGLDYITSFLKKEILIDGIMYNVYFLAHMASINDDELTFM